MYAFSTLPPDAIRSHSCSRTPNASHAYGNDKMTQDQDRILRIRAVLQRTGLSRTTMYRKMQNGTFPKSIRISTRCAGWRESAVNEWMKNPMFYCVEEHLHA